jgi:hypothetical protein
MGIRVHGPPAGEQAGWDFSKLPLAAKTDCGEITPRVLVVP